MFRRAHALARPPPALRLGFGCVIDRGVRVDDFALHVRPSVARASVCRREWCGLVMLAASGPGRCLIPRRPVGWRQWLGSV